MSVVKEEGVVQSLATRINQLQKDDVTSGIRAADFFEQEVNRYRETHVVKKNEKEVLDKKEKDAEQNVVGKIEKYIDAKEALSYDEER